MFLLQGSGSRCRASAVSCSGADVWLIMRTLFDGPKDRAGVHANQDRFRISSVPYGNILPAPRPLPVAPKRAEVVSHFVVYERGLVTMIAGRFGPGVMPGWPAG